MFHFRLQIRILAILLLLASACSQSLRFADRPVVRDLDDRRPVPVPEATRYVRMDYYAKVLVKKPATRLLTFSRKKRALDVNALDQVPRSSWYTPRLGYSHLSPEDLLVGPARTGPPVPPLRVVRAKHRGNSPGFVIADSRDQLYLVKFDPREWPGLETTTAFVANRLFWGFGYNVPEDYTIYFNSAEVPRDSTADITQEEIQLVFDAVAPPSNGLYRATASLLLDGLYLGPMADTGVRKGDRNDRFPHQRLRILRALRVFGAFANQTDIRIDNSLDVYQGLPGEGHIRHYLVDFGGAFGGRGAKFDRLWNGYMHIFSFTDLMVNLTTLGLYIRPWESIPYQPWPSVGPFEAEKFEPAEWRENYPFAPIRNALDDDNYWAAKIVASLSRDHLRVLVEGAQYPHPAAEEYMIETLWQRRQKVIDCFFRRVSPLEWTGFSGNAIRITDLGKVYQSGTGEIRYQVSFLDDGDHRVVPDTSFSAQQGPLFEIPLRAEMFEKARQYLKLRITVWEDEQEAPRAAWFHLRGEDGKPWRVCGVVH
ncbi:MAG TPA: hypothetical protein PKV71_09875 [Calditrichia bacterium]|nr:hypothetical protein [Calditrichia bacterium]